MSWRDSQSGSSTWKGGGTNSGVQGGVGGSGNTGGGGGGNSGWGGDGSGGGNAGANGMGGWGSNLRGRDGLTASQRAQTRDSRLGLKTGATWHGNTAFGKPGQMAAGYTTISNQGGGFGMRPTMENYSNFRNLDGSQMFPGAGGSVQAPNAFAGAAMMQQQMRPQTTPQPSGPHPAGAPAYDPYAFPTMYTYPPLDDTPVIGGPWPGQATWPTQQVPYTNPPIYRPNTQTPLPPGYNPPFNNNYVPGTGINNIQSGDSWLNNGWGATGWNMSTDPAQGVGPQHSNSPPSGGNGSAKLYNDRVPADNNKMSQSGAVQSNKMAKFGNRNVSRTWNNANTRDFRFR